MRRPGTQGLHNRLVLGPTGKNHLAESQLPRVTAHTVTDDNQRCGEKQLTPPLSKHSVEVIENIVAGGGHHIHLFTPPVQQQGRIGLRTLAAVNLGIGHLGTPLRQGIAQQGTTTNATHNKNAFPLYLTQGGGFQQRLAVEAILGNDINRVAGLGQGLGSTTPNSSDLQGSGYTVGQ
jgi:hypothetical protein